MNPAYCLKLKELPLTQTTSSSEVYPVELLAKTSSLGQNLINSFLISPQAFFEFLNDNNLISQIFAFAQANHPHDLDQAVIRLRHLILKGRFSEALTQQLYSFYSSQIHHQRAYLTAVNHSLTEWQVDDRLIHGESDLLVVLRQTWANLINPSFFQSQRFYDTNLIAPYYWVCQIPKADFSGVFKSVYSSSEKNISLLSVTEGLGSIFRHPEIIPDYYYLNRLTGQVINQQLTRYPQKLELNHRGQLKLISIPAKNLKNPILTPVQINLIHQAAKKIHNFYLKPISVHFSFYRSQLTLIKVQFNPEVIEAETNLGLAQAPTLAPHTPLLAQGVACSPGQATAKIKFVSRIKRTEDLDPGDLLYSPQSSLNLVPYLKQISGLITAEGGITSHLAIICRELGIPLVSGVDAALNHLYHQQTVTLNGTTGEITTPSSQSTNFINQPSLAPSTFRTATKIYPFLSEGRQAESFPQGMIHGFIVQGSYLLTTYGQHPLHLKNNRQLPLYRQFLARQLKTLASINPNLEIVYLPSDLQALDLAQLKGGKAYETDSDSTGFIGLRGMTRILANPEFFDAEISTIHELIDKNNFSFSIILPFIRHFSEYQMIRHHLYQAKNYNIRKIKLFLSIDTPAVALSLNSFAGTNLPDGLSLNLDHFTPMVLGIDPRQSELNPLLDPRHPGVIALIREIFKFAHSQKIPVNVRGFLLSRYSDLITSLVEMGVHSITVNASSVEEVRSQLHHAELHHLKL